MAATICTNNQATSTNAANESENGPKATLINKIEHNQAFVNALVILRGEDGVITACEDKTIRIWLKRDTGQYWPSVCHTMPSACSCMDFNQQTYRLFVGCDNGVVAEFEVSDDYNKLTHKRDYFAHSNGVTGVLFSLHGELLLSVGKDRQFVWHCTETGQRLGCFNVGASCTSLQYDSAAKYAFVGDYAGNVSVLRLRENVCELISNDLRAHTASVTSLSWDAERQLLFSAGSDNLIIVWDIGGRQGNAYELLAHKTKIVALAYADGAKKLFSVNDGGGLVIWDMNAKRQMTPTWLDSGTCQRCDTPFFWNLKEMWSKRVVGLRQHHCRLCGKAVCDKCSQRRLRYPIMGYEIDVRACDVCFRELENKNCKSLATFCQLKHNVNKMQLDEMQNRLVTFGSDRVIKIWDVKELLRMH